MQPADRRATEITSAEQYFAHVLIAEPGPLERTGARSVAWKSSGLGIDRIGGLGALQAQRFLSQDGIAERRALR
ncbi:hypothetical protein [Rhodopseudomonas pseudopalustris]|uniref:Uncharacterized protein n=1 Tax=Rhodopseudomonas pseudopalustris TaxID=1513892 RepID=A0A1H8U2B5_9BRAD|nr:hypothetical protein [Rhodopseudomonas pseudopalustris]SEO96778.1 hypothetical protein SAMN05444123_106225 [Rhodopseudomonas pseudopalustris]